MEPRTLNVLVSKPSALSLIDEKQDFSYSPILSTSPSAGWLLSNNPTGNISRSNVVTDTAIPFGNPRDGDGTEEDAGYQSDVEGYNGSFDAVEHIKRRLSRTNPSKNSRRALEIIERRRCRQPNSSKLPVLKITSVPNDEYVETYSHDFDFDESRIQYQSHVDVVPSPTISDLVRATVEGPDHDFEHISPGSSVLAAGLEVPLLSGSNINSYADSGFYSSIMITSTPIMSVMIGSIRTFNDDASFCGINDSSSMSMDDFIVTSRLERSATEDLLVDISLDSPQFHTCVSFLASPDMMNNTYVAPASYDQSKVLVGLGLGHITEISLNSSSSIARFCDETLFSNSLVPDASSAHLTQEPIFVESCVKPNLCSSEIDPIGGLSDTTNVDVDHLIKPTTPSPRSHPHSATAVLKIVETQLYHPDHQKSPVCTANFSRVRDTKLIKERIERSAVLQNKNSRLSYPSPVQIQKRDNRVPSALASTSSEDQIDLLRKLGLCSFKLSSDNDPRSPHIPMIYDLLDFTYIYTHHSHNPFCPPQIDPDAHEPSFEEADAACTATANPCYPTVTSEFSLEGTLVESKSAEGIGIGLPSGLTSQPPRQRDLSSSYSWDEISLDTIPTAEECENLAQLASVPSPNGEPVLRVNRSPLKRQVEAPLKKMQFLKFAKRRLSTIPENPTTLSPKMSLKARPAPSSTDLQDSSANDSNLSHVKRQLRRASWFASSVHRVVSFLHIRKKFTFSTNKPNQTNQTQSTSSYDPGPNANGSPGLIEHSHIPRGLGIFKRGDSPPLAGKEDRRPKPPPWRLNFLF